MTAPELRAGGGFENLYSGGMQSVIHTRYLNGAGFDSNSGVKCSPLFSVPPVLNDSCGLKMNYACMNCMCELCTLYLLDVNIV